MLVLERADSVFVNRGAAHLHMRAACETSTRRWSARARVGGGVHEERTLVAATISGEFQMWHFVDELSGALLSDPCESPSSSPERLWRASPPPLAPDALVLHAGARLPSPAS